MENGLPFNRSSKEKLKIFLESGVNPIDPVFDLSSKDITHAIECVSSVPYNTKAEVILLLEQDLIKDRKKISSFEFGIFLAKIEESIEDKQGFTKIVDDVRDLNKLPFIVEKEN